jgi:hypothetical protein
MEKGVTHVVGQNCYPCRRLHRTRSGEGLGVGKRVSASKDSLRVAKAGETPALPGKLTQAVEAAGGVAEEQSFL